MTNDELKSQTATLDKKIGETKTELLALESVQEETLFKIAEARKRLTNLCRQRDDLLTPDLFA
jgi:chromosome segregation ATPase